jgi:uncharacterized protein (DUF488 family)
MPTLYTIGHSNHTLAEFISWLKTYQIKHIVDIRTLPKSRHVPWFNSSALKLALNKEKINYTHMAKLGGLRHPHKDSINDAWENASFRGFADYMQTAEFFEGLKSLNKLLKQEKTAIMCAEAVPWRCHRSLIADAEIIRRIKVLHIMSNTNLRPHELTAFAKVDRSTKPIKIYYPAQQTDLLKSHHKN